jgi:hypothetical protein
LFRLFTKPKIMVSFFKYQWCCWWWRQQRLWWLQWW